MYAKKVYKVYNTEAKHETHEYTITQDRNKDNYLVTTLSRSHEEMWSEDNKGEELISLIDTGDEVTFPKKLFAGDVGYDRFAELFILLSFINKTETYGLYKGRIEQVYPSKTFEI